MAKRDTPPWADENLKIWLTLLYLDDGARRKTLTAAIEEHATDDGGFGIPDAPRSFLVGYPIDGDWLASLRELRPVPTKTISDVAPRWDGEDDPIAVRRGSDLARLPNLEVLAWPSASIDLATIAALPKLRELTIPLSDDRGRSIARVLAKLEQAGWAVDSTTGPCGRATLVRGRAANPSVALLGIVDKLFPKQVFTRGKGGVGLFVRERGAARGPLVVTIGLSVYTPNGDVGELSGAPLPGVRRRAQYEGVPGPDVEEVAEYELVSAAEMAAPGAADRLRARIESIVAFARKQRCLPAPESIR